MGQLGADVDRMMAHAREATIWLAERFGITDVGGVRPDPIRGHPDGLAADFMTRNGTGLAEFARANHEALGGVDQVIWNRKIWTLERADEGWRDYTGTDNPHTDHVHIKWRSQPSRLSLTGLRDTAVGGLFDLDGFMGQVEGTTVTLLAAGLGVALVGVGVVLSVRSTVRNQARKVLG